MAVGCTDWLDITIMKHARNDYNRIQDPGLENPDLVPNGSMPIAADEPVFLLRASDITAAQTVLYWARLNEEIKGDENAIKLAKDHAVKMAAWPRKKVADV